MQRAGWERQTGRRTSRYAGTTLALVGLVLGFAPACAHRGSTSPVRSSQEGIASFYAPALAGRATASGEAYDPAALTAAHRTLPFGTIVRVARTGSKATSGRDSVEVRINDRGPFVKGRIIDLSEAAARAIDLEHEGVARVRVEIVALPSS